MKKIFLILLCVLVLGSLVYSFGFNPNEFSSTNTGENPSQILSKQSKSKKRSNKKPSHSTVTSIDSVIVSLWVPIPGFVIKFYLSDDTSFIQGKDLLSENNWSVTDTIETSDAQLLKRLISDIYITEKTKPYKAREKVNYSKESEFPWFTFKIYKHKQKMKKIEVLDNREQNFYILTYSEELDSLFDLLYYYGYRYNNKYLEIPRQVRTEKFKHSLKNN